MNTALITFRLKMSLAIISVLLLGGALTYGIIWVLYGGSISGFVIITGLVIMALILTLFQWLLGPYFINMMYRAYEVKPDDPSYGWVYDIVSEVAMSNGLKTPKVFIADVPFPNAFAYGNFIAGSRVAITKPLLRILNKDELKAVLGHELGHLKHKDVEVLMAIGLIPTVIYWLGWSLWWSGLWSGGWNERNNGGGLIALIGLALLAVSFLFQLFVLYINRLREAYADINGALTVEDGARNLQRALAKIELSIDPRIMNRVNGTMKMLFFAPGVKEEEIPTEDVDRLIEYWRHYKPSVWEELLMDHPHPAKRIQLLDRFIYG